MRSAVRLLAPLALAAAPSVRANVTGDVEVQSQTTQNVSQPGAGTTQSTLLMEGLSLHYAGLPFGPAVAIATAGGAFSNVTGWGNGLQLSGRVYSFDASVGLLPRRAVPLRLYGAGSFEDGATGALASRGPGLSLLYGAAVNSEPGRYLPGLRAEASEGRSARPGHERMSDIQRRVSASSFGTVAGQRVDLGLRLDDDHRDAAGDASYRAATLNLSSPRHQTSFLATETRRSLAVLATLPVSANPALPPPSGITSDRMLSATSDQRWAPELSTQLGGRLSESGADSATGRLGDLRAGVTWVPVRGTQQLTLSWGGNTGFTRTSSPTVESSGTSWGTTAHAGYGRPVGPFSAGLGLGGAVNGCDCAGLGNEGTTRQLDANGSLALLPAGRASWQIDHTVTAAFAPIDRGGDRLENHSRTSGRLAVGESSAVSAGLSYDDGFRELVDITTGRTVGLHERAVTGSLGLSTQLRRVALSTEVRQSRGSVVTNGSPFIAGAATQVRTLTSGYVTSAWSAVSGLALQAQLVGTRAELSHAPGTTSVGANLGLVWRLGRLNATIQYQGARVHIDGSPSTFQQSIRTMLSRPFELWR
jgi:hypothetical protein